MEYSSETFVDLTFYHKGNIVAEKVTTHIPGIGHGVHLEDSGRLYVVSAVRWRWPKDGNEPAVEVTLK